MNSLGTLVDSIEQKRYFGQRIPARELLAKAREIASRQGLPDSYAGMFAPTKLDFRRGIRVFTGEPVRSGAATAHVLGEECCRLLLKLSVKDRLVLAALARAEAGMRERLNSCERTHARHVGFYCCGICTVSFWRHLAAGGRTARRRDSETACGCWQAAGPTTAAGIGSRSSTRCWRSPNSTCRKPRKNCAGPRRPPSEA